MFNNDIDRLKGVADTVLEVIKKSQDKTQDTLDEAITRSVKDGVTTVTRTGADAKTQHVTPGKSGYGPSRAKSLAKMGMAAAEADRKKKESLKKEDMTHDELIKQGYQEVKTKGLNKDKGRPAYIKPMKKESALNEYTPGSGGVTRVTGKSYGASHQSNTDIADNNSQASGPLSMKGPSDKDLKKIDRDNKIDAKKPFSQMREDYAQNGLPSLQKKYNDLSVTPGQSAKPAFYADKQTDGVDHQTDNTRSATKKNQDQYEAEMKKNQKFMSQRKDDKEEAASGSVPSAIRVSVRNESAPMSTVTNDDIHQELDEMFPMSFNGGVRVLKSQKLHPNQQEIDVVDDDKIDAKDFKKLRSMKKEGESPEADYKKNMKHHVMHDTIASKKKGMSGLEENTPKDAYFDNVVLDEKKMTDDEEEHKEYIVKGMKKNLKSFKDTYGKDAKNVMYATATKLAQNEATLTELSPKTLGSYTKKAHKDATDHSFDHGEDEYRQYGSPDDEDNQEKELQDRERKINNRKKGINTATNKLVKKATNEDKKVVRPNYWNPEKTNAERKTNREKIDKMKKVMSSGLPELTSAQKKSSVEAAARAKKQFMGDNQR